MTNETTSNEPAEQPADERAPADLLKEALRLHAAAVTEEHEQLHSDDTKHGLPLPSPKHDAFVAFLAAHLAPAALPPSPAPQPVPHDEPRWTLVHSLMASKGWMRGYAEAYVDAALAAPQPVLSGEPVARVVSWTSGSYWRNYKLEWMRDVPAGALLYTAPAAAPEAAPGRDAAGWISTDDRLPAPGQLVAVSGWKYDSPMNGRWFAAAKIEGRCCIDHTSGDELYWPTHWLLIPPVENAGAPLAAHGPNEHEIGAVAVPQVEPAAPSPAFQLFRDAISWGRTYGPVIGAAQWDEMRDDMARQFVKRSTPEVEPAAAAQERAMPDTAPFVARLVMSHLDREDLARLIKKELHAYARLALTPPAPGEPS